MRIKAVILVIALTAVSALSVTDSVAESTSGWERNGQEIRERSNRVLELWAGRDNDLLDQELAKIGWAQMKTEPGDVVGIESATYCGTVTPFRAYQQSTGRWLVVGQWAWNDGSCGTDWTNDSPLAPEDGIVMGVTDSFDNQVDVPAVGAGGNVFDQDGTRYPGIRANWLNQAAAGYALADRFEGSWSVKFVGHHGAVWFYLDRRPSGTDHYLQICWVHNWSDANTTLQSINIGYPWVVKLNYAPGSAVRQWSGNGACQKVRLTYQYYS